ASGTRIKGLVMWLVVLAVGAAPWVAWSYASAQEHGDNPASAEHGATHAAGAAGGEHTEAAGEHAGNGGEHELGEINWADFTNKKQPPYAAYLANFGILLFLYWYLGRNALPAALKERRNAIAREI